MKRWPILHTEMELWVLNCIKQRLARNVERMARIYYGSTAPQKRGAIMRTLTRLWARGEVWPGLYLGPGIGARTPWFIGREA